MEESEGDQGWENRFGIVPVFAQSTALADHREVHNNSTKRPVRQLEPACLLVAESDRSRVVVSVTFGFQPWPIQAGLSILVIKLYIVT